MNEDQIYDIIFRIRMQAERDDLTANETLDLLEEEFEQEFRYLE